jgi:hypothetical protein
MRGGLGKVRERLYDVVTESAPMPDLHANGHGNGHAVEGNGHGEPATVPANDEDEQ